MAKQKLGDPTDFSYRVDKVIKIENIQEEFKEIQKLYNCNIPLPHENTTNHNSYKTYYDDEMIEYVKKICATDLKIYDYDF